MAHRSAIAVCATLRTGLLLLALTATGFAQLSGLYTVNPLAPGGGSNFTSLTSAVQALLAQGVTGPVVFELFDDAGPYTDAMPFTTTNVTWGTSDAVLTLGTWAGAATDRPVAFRAAPGEFPVLDATGRAMGVFWNGADHVTIEGLEIRGADYDAVAIYSEAGHGQVESAVIRRCRLHDCGGAGVMLHGNLPHPQDTVIENNFFWNLQTTNAGGFNTLSRFGYVSARRTNGTRVRHNTFHVATATGSFFTVMGGFPGSLTDTPFEEVFGNVIVKTVASGRPVFWWPTIGGVASLPLVQDRNCIHDPSGGPFGFHGTNGQSIASTLAAWRTAVGRDLASLDADPLLSAPAVGDLHLLPGSPCVDAATAPLLVLDDIDGETRTLADLGADELTSGPAPTATPFGLSATHSTGLVPFLQTNQIPALGTAAFPLTVTPALPNSFAYLFAAYATAPGPIPLGSGNTFWLDPVTADALAVAGVSPVGPIQTGAGGTATTTFTIPNDPTLAGFVLVVQAAVLDPAITAGFVTTNALVLPFN